MPHLTPTVLPDTNYLLDFPFLLEEKWLLSPLEILISETVSSELRGLTQNKNPQRSQKAEVALREINKYRGPLAELSEGKNGVSIKFVERYTDPSNVLDTKIPDHQIIAYANELLHEDHPRFCAILSNDQELVDIAEAITVFTVSRHNEQRFHQELSRKFEWWQKGKEAEHSKAVSIQKTPRVQKVETLSEKQILLNRTIKRLYRRIEAVGCHTTIYLAPMEARIAITLEVLRRLRSPDKQTIIVAVETKEAAQYWAGELRQLGSYSSSEIQIFGVDPVDRIDQAKVVIYRHDQIARRIPHHVARLDQAEKRITAVIDGCDLLDPVELAILLYESDQFIGLNHYPLGYRQTRGHRMLSAILHNRSLINYSFADAECDGWGPTCDLYLQKIEFTMEERKMWDEINAEYVRQRESAVEEYPDLGETDDFWDALEHLLNRAAIPEIVELIKLREQREQMGQIAHNKLPKIIQLIRSTPKQPYRRLIFDYSHQWTPVLLKELPQTGINVAELPEGEDQRETWDDFAGNKVDTLLLSKVPDLSLPGAHFHQLIIITPFRPMDEILAMIDWALSHTQTKDALGIDLLYVDDTPEEIAMLELAEASFGLRYE